MDVKKPRYREGSGTEDLVELFCDEKFCTLLPLTGFYFAIL